MPDQPYQQDQHDHMEPDEQANLVLELTIEPMDQSLEDLFGLDDEQLAEVTAATIARLQIEELVKISVLVTDDENLRMLNREFRGQDSATDVLSFPAQDAPIISAPSDQLWQHAGDEPDAEEEHLTGSNGATPGARGEAALDAALMDAEGDLEGEFEDDFEGDFEEELDDELDELADAALDLGDIAISAESVKRQAGTAGHSAAWEFSYVLVHGILHLAGYDDQTEAGYLAMVQLQDAILAEVNIRK